MIDFGKRFLPQPPKISEIKKTISDVKINFGDVAYHLLAKYLDAIEGVFNFGTISDNHFQKLYDDTQAHAKTEIGFVLPFANFAFRCSVEDESGAVGKTYISIKIPEKNGLMQDMMLLAVHKQNGEMPVWAGILKSNSKNRHNIDSFQSLNLNATEKDNFEIGRIIAVPIFMFSLVLNTKNIPKVTEIPSPKLQQKRAKENLPPLPYTTNVNLNAYMIARNNTESGNTGTHASPRPHLRRAHLRTVVRGEETITIPVQQCMVNWDGGSPLMREEYKVKTTNLEK